MRPGFALSSPPVSADCTSGLNRETSVMPVIHQSRTGKTYYLRSTSSFDHVNLPGVLMRRAVCEYV